MKAMRDVWGEKLVQLGTTDPRTVVLDGDLANSTKADKFALAHPERFFQMGIAEQNLIGAAAGLASVGYRAVDLLIHRVLHAPRARSGAHARRAKPRQREDRRLVLRFADRRCRQDPSRRPGHCDHAGHARHGGGGPGR